MMNQTIFICNLYEQYQNYEKWLPIVEEAIARVEKGDYLYKVDGTARNELVNVSSKPVPCNISNKRRINCYVDSRNPAYIIVYVEIFKTKAGFSTQAKVAFEK